MIRWRPMATDDLGTVLAIADILHPHYPERLEIFADKLAFDAESCRIAEDQAGRIVGYMFAHAWRQGMPPLLDCELGPRPADADCLHLHDIALLPTARGQGGPRDALAYLAELARRRATPTLTLVAIKGQEPYWRAKGFTAVAAAGELALRLRSYGDGVAYMVKTNT